jgi:pseudaminic acid synthase
MEFQIGNTKIGSNHPTYFIAELSCNHHGSLDTALELVQLAHKAGANAVKTQTYTGDTITLKSNKPCFKLEGTNWDSKGTLWDLFNEAHTPWEWNNIIKKETEKLGMDFLSSPFDETAVDHLEDLDVNAYKVASMEIVDIPLLKKIASTGKPVIVSTGMASLSEIDEAISTLKNNGSGGITLLKCTSAYPSDPADANLATIKNLSETFEVLAGLSDHTLGISVPVTAYALGARIIEKHFIKDRSEGGPDSSFSLEPDEFKNMIDTIRIAEKAIGNIHYGGVKGEVRIFRRSLFVVKDMKKDDEFIEGYNIRSIRPGNGLHTRYMWDFVGKKASQDIEAGTPVSWDLI